MKELTLFQSLFVILLLGWSLAWKGVALWKAAHNSAKVWYIVLLVLNTAGILEIFYIFLFSKGTNRQELSVAEKN